MPRINLHLLSDSTGETLEAIAKAALAQFEGADVVRHFWASVPTLGYALPSSSAKSAMASIIKRSVPECTDSAQTLAMVRTLKPVPPPR